VFSSPTRASLRAARYGGSARSWWIRALLSIAGTSRGRYPDTVSYARAEAEFYAAAHRRLEAALAHSRDMIERSRQTIERFDALLAEAADRFGHGSSPAPLLDPLGEGDEVR
jgi:hypothetical protein